MATLEAEVDQATKAVLNMEEKVLKNEANLVRLLGDQTSLKLDCLNLKRVELEKSSQMREARVALREYGDKNRQADTELMATLCGRALAVSETRPVPFSVVEVAPATGIATAHRGSSSCRAAPAAETAPSRKTSAAVPVIRGRKIGKDRNL